MSDPAQKALGPAPVTMTQRIVSLSLHIVTASTIAFAMAGVAALNLSGRLSVIVATGPSTVNRIVSVMMCGSGHRRFAGGRAAPHAACRRRGRRGSAPPPRTERRSRRRGAGGHGRRRASRRCCDRRPEEHTSELQSLMRISYAFSYLKKKKESKKRL